MIYSILFLRYNIDIPSWILDKFVKKAVVNKSNIYSIDQGKKITEDDINSLLALGFDRETVAHALEATLGDVTLAADLLLK